MLPLSGEEWEGLGSGKWVKTSNWAAMGLSQGTWASEVLLDPSGSQTRASGFPKTQSKRRGVGQGAHLPHTPIQLLSCVLSHAPPSLLPS